MNLKVEQLRLLKPKIKKKKEWEKNNSLRQMWDIIKTTNIHVMWVPEDEEKENEKKKIFKKNNG